MRLNVTRNRFYDFLNFVNLSGVNFNTRMGRITVTGQYHGGPNGVRENYFRLHKHFTLEWFDIYQIYIILHAMVYNNYRKHNNTNAILGTEVSLNFTTHATMYSS